MLLISHPCLTHSPVKAQLTPPSRSATSTPRSGTPPRAQDAVRHLGEPEIRGLGHYIDNHFGDGARVGTVEVVGLGHYIDNHLGDDRFHIR